MEVGFPAFATDCFDMRRKLHRLEGSGAVRRIPFEMHQGEFVQAPLASPGGVAERSESFNNNDCRWQSYLDPIAGRLDGSSEPARLTEEGWRQVKILFALRPVVSAQSHYPLASPGGKLSRQIIGTSEPIIYRD